MSAPAMSQPESGSSSTKRGVVRLVFASQLLLAVLGAAFCSVIGLVLVPHLQTEPDYSKVSQETIDELTKQAATLGVSKELQEYYVGQSMVDRGGSIPPRIRKNMRTDQVISLIENNADLAVKLCKGGRTDLAKQLFVTIARVDKEFAMGAISLAHLPQRCIPEGLDVDAPAKPLPPLSNSVAK